jgi:hypothetical protein
LSHMINASSLMFGLTAVTLLYTTSQTEKK